jgi:dihydroorotase
MDFTPLMTLYLTDDTKPREISSAKASNIVHAVKLYPAGATTNSAAGVTDLKKCTATIARMEKLGVPLLVHGEVTDPAVDIFDREAVFIDTVLIPILRNFPALKVVLEHITTREGVDFVRSAGPNVAGTLTAHHLLLNRNAIFAGGIRPHHYCLPVLKREIHRKALVAAAISGNPKFFLGTDSAPHGQSTKEAACGCAGCYTAHAGIELYAEAFEMVGALDKLEGFASFHGADWYGLPRNTQQITLQRKSRTIPKSLDYIDGDRLVPFLAGEDVLWQLVSS